MGTRVAPLCLCSWLGFCKLRVRTTEEPDRSWFALSPDKWETGTPGREQMEVISEEIRWESSSQILGCCSLCLGADRHWSPWTWPMFSGSVYQSGKEKMVFTHFLVMLYRLNGAADHVFWDVSERKLKEVTHRSSCLLWWEAGGGRDEGTHVQACGSQRTLLGIIPQGPCISLAWNLGVILGWRASPLQAFTCPFLSRSGIANLACHA